MKTINILRMASGNYIDRRLSILREAEGDDQQGGGKEPSFSDADANDQDTTTQEENAQEDEAGTDEENPDTEENPDEEPQEEESVDEGEGDDPSFSDADSGDSGGDDGTDPGEQPDEESPDELKNKGLLNDAIYLYQSVDETIGKLEGFRHSNIIANKITVQVKKNLMSLKEMLYRYITSKHQQYAYEKNLYISRYFIEAYKLNVRLLSKIGDFTQPQ